MTGLLLALSAAPGMFYLYTALVFGCRGMGMGSSSARLAGRRSGLSDWLVQAGLAGVDPRQFAAVSAGLAVAGAMAGLGVFGGPCRRWRRR